jgi:hypothetical protein
MANEGPAGLEIEFGRAIDVIMQTPPNEEAGQ